MEYRIVAYIETYHSQHTFFYNQLRIEYQQLKLYALVINLVVLNRLFFHHIIDLIDNNLHNFLFDQIVNKYTKFDPTSPRIYNLPCPNKNCFNYRGVSSG